jgi:hypothetical protein
MTAMPNPAPQRVTKWCLLEVFQNSETAFSRLTELNKIGGAKNAGVVGG